MRAVGSASRSSAVSPVVAVMLLLAICIVLSAMVGGFVFDLTGGDSSSTPTGQVAVQATAGDDGSLTVQLLAKGEAENVIVRNSNGDEKPLLIVGETATIPTYGERVTILAGRGDSQQVIQTYDPPYSGGGVSDVGVTETQLDDSLVAYWNFEGSTVEQISSTAGETVGSPAFSPEAPVGDQSLSLGPDDGLRASTETTVPSGNDDIVSFSMWFKPSATEHQVLLNIHQAYTIFYDRSGEKDINFATYGANIDAGVSLSPEKWHHVVVVWDTGSWVSVYVDGVQYRNQTPYTETSGDGSSPFELGVKYGTEIADYAGELDEVRLYTRGLSGDEAQALFDQGF